jgi:HSP20 family protein
VTPSDLNYITSTIVAGGASHRGTIKKPQQLEKFARYSHQTARENRAPGVAPWRPFESLRHEIDRLFEDFDGGMWRSRFGRPTFDLQPFWPRESTWAAVPAVDIAETDKAYEITAELPGMDEKNIEVKFADGVLTIRGEKKDEKEEKKKDYYLSERSYGSFQRSFQVPDGVDTDKIEATFKKGVLSVALPKSVEAQKAARRST